MDLREAAGGEKRETQTARVWLREMLSTREEEEKILSRKVFLYCAVLDIKREKKNPFTPKKGEKDAFYQGTEGHLTKEAF